MRKEEFDDIIKKQIIEKYGESHFHWNTDYDKYNSKNDFDVFTEEMRLGFPCAYKEYGAGKGCELNPKTVNHHVYPPKMASVASSSRFCYPDLRYDA